MYDGTDASGGDGADATFQALRGEFLEDSTEDLQNLISFLNEAMASSRPMQVVLRDARRVAVNLVGGANGFELPLIGVAAPRSSSAPLRTTSIAAACAGHGCAGARTCTSDTCSMSPATI